MKKEQKKDKNIKVKKTPVKSKKEINKAILELSKETNRSMTKRMFKDLIDA